MFRSVTQVPGVILGLASCFLFLQLAMHHLHKEDLQFQFKHLNYPLTEQSYRLLALGSDRLLSYLLSIKLQLHDNQKGKHLPYSRLDYDVLSKWLSTIYSLYPESDYPAFLASRVYSQVKDPAKIRLMIKQIGLMFDSNPEQHWRRMTEACLLAKHHLNDLPLALTLAEKISALPVSYQLPFWARDMRLILLDELNQHQSAVVLISSLLQSGQVKDADERRFLEHRLLKIQQILSENRQDPITK